MKLNQEQSKVVYSAAKKMIVLSSAAAGKTACISERLKYLLQIGINPKEIVAITFTNNAADELYSRVNCYNGLFIGTIHSYINRLLLFENIDTKELIEQERFDELFNILRQHPECIQPVKYLLVDEIQDSPRDHFDIFFNYIKPQNWALFGDIKQQIYGFLGADSNIILNMIEDDPQIEVLELNNNYRNDKKILEFAKLIIKPLGKKYTDNSIPMSQVDGKVIESEFDPVLLSRYIKMKENYKNWFVLFRTNEQLQYFLKFLQTERVPYVILKRNELNTQELKQKISGNCVKLMTIHAAKGLEADNVAVVGARFYNPSEKKISYVAATRARHLLMWMTQPNITRRSNKTTNWQT